MLSLSAAVRTSFMLSCLVMVIGCNGNVQTPETPRLEAVNLLGQRICGPFTSSTTTFNFACDPLPASVGTGWLLSPLRKPHPTNPNWSNLNRGIVFTVSTPTTTSIEVAYRAGSGARYVLSQVTPGPGRPQMLQAGPGEVEVAAADDGVRKIWTIAAQTNPCLEKMELEVVNISGGTRSDTLPIHVLRNQSETYCINTPPVGTAGGPFIGTAGTNGVGMGPTGPSPSGPCSSGGSRKFFDLCETCSTGTSTVAQYTGIESCSLNDAFAVMGYGPGGVKTGGPCNISLTSSEVACEGGP